MFVCLSTCQIHCTAFKITRPILWTLRKQYIWFLSEKIFGDGHPSCLYEGPHSFPRRNNSEKSYSYLKSYSPESLGQFEPNLAQSIPKWTELHNIQMEGHALFLWPGDPRLRGILLLSCLSFCYSETLKLKTSEMFLSVPITGTAQCYASLPSNFHEYLWCHDAGKVP